MEMVNWTIDSVYVHCTANIQGISKFIYSEFHGMIQRMKIYINGMIWSRTALARFQLGLAHYSRSPEDAVIALTLVFTTYDSYQSQRRRQRQNLYPYHLVYCAQCFHRACHWHNKYINESSRSTESPIRRGDKANDQIQHLRRKWHD